MLWLGRTGNTAQVPSFESKRGGVTDDTRIDRLSQLLSYDRTTIELDAILRSIRSWNGLDPSEVSAPPR